MALASANEAVARIEVDETHRAQLPLQTFPISSGIKGGIAGGIAMVIPAEIYGILRFHSIWYVVNLLGGAGVGDWVNPTVEEMRHFRLSAFVTANIIQGCTTLLVGLLYGAMLPIWPRRPILLGGIIAPAIWTGLLYSSLGIVNPFLAQRIDWWSFAASQVIFGLVAGYTVTKLGGLKNSHRSRFRYGSGWNRPVCGRSIMAQSIRKASRSHEGQVYRCEPLRAGDSAAGRMRSAWPSTSGAGGAAA